MKHNIILSETTDNDLNEILFVENEAFKDEYIEKLTRNLIFDTTAQPILSLLARIDYEAVGHILFTKASIAEHSKLKVYILAPLAVLPDYQNQGIGKALTEKGLSILREWGVDLVFVLGHPSYYPRFGFTPHAAGLGYKAPYPIKAKNSNAWMILRLNSKVEPFQDCTVQCAKALDRPEYWRE